MSKRSADRPLDYDNWDAPDEPVKPGVFEEADEATIKARNIIVPRRRSAQPVTQSKRGLFKTLDAFGSPQTANSPTSFIQTPKSEPKSSVYLSKLAILNKEVSAWISKHVSEDPYCILTPIFNDYAKHLASIETPRCDVVFEKSESPPQTATNSGSSTVEKSPVLKIVPSEQSNHSTVTTTTSTTTTTNGFSFRFQSTTSTASSVAKPPLFSFGLTPSISSNNATSNTPIFSFVSAPVKPPEDPNFGTTSAAVVDQGDEEEYIPPKPEVKEIKEEGSVYTVRCKLFYKSAEQWTERGLGNLHIIPSGEEKFQLLIRADTNLGNILLNIMLTKDIPMQLQKNNITFACVPSPPLPGTAKAKTEEEANLPPRPVPMLIRVKSAEAAEALLHEIDKHRGKKSK